jgi:predicted peptidase
MHLRRITGVSLLSLFCLGAFAQDVPQDKPQPQNKLMASEKATVSRSYTLEHTIFLPKDYSPSGTNTWPMIFFLHGAGERGTNVWRSNFHGPSKYLLDHPEFPFILVSPQCPPDEIWSNESLLALLDHVQGKYRVDATRIYLTGLSMGGYGTWELGTAHPERFAAMAPVCGGGRRINIILAARGYAPAKLNALQSLGIWVFHGGKDTVVPPEESELMLEALKVAKVGQVNYTLYPEAGHDAWTETYKNPELYDWFLKHRRTQ